MLIVEEHVLQGQPEILAKCVQLADILPGILGKYSLSIRLNRDMFRSARNARLEGIPPRELMSAAIVLLIRFPKQDGLSASTALLEKRLLRTVHRLAADLPMCG